jgi:hypothetical protein
MVPPCLDGSRYHPGIYRVLLSVLLLLLGVVETHALLLCRCRLIIQLKNMCAPPPDHTALEHVCPAA